MTSRHWDAIFSEQGDSELGWYESDLSQTFTFIDLIPSTESTTTFLAGAGTSQLVDALLAKQHQLIINDISTKALKTLQRRLGKTEAPSWLQHDLSKPLPVQMPQVDLWVDRAVLHFLLSETDIQTYFRNVTATVRANGYVLLAEFSKVGAPKCAGLEVHRYSIEEMTQRLGKEFKLIHHEDYVFITPFGEPRPYVYALYQRVAQENSSSVISKRQ